MYAQVRKDEKKQYDMSYNLVKLVCSFINPERAQRMFTEGEHINNEGFAEDLKSFDPNFKEDTYSDVLEE